LLENISHDIEEEGGEGVALPKPPMTLDLPSRDVVEENGCLARSIGHFDPSPPQVRKALGKEDPIEGFPANGVEGFTEFEFKDCGRH
jgi:hypothetical protein